MRRIFIALLLALAGAGISQAQVSPIRGWCESGAQQVILAGLNSTTQVQASFPQCTVTVSIHGDGAATIFADANSTPLGNPFTAQTNGQWIFYVASGRYDVQLSGAGFPTPITYSDIFTTGAGGATVIPGGSPIQTQVNNNGVFGGTPCESFPNILTGPELVDCDWHSRGPNPYVDVTRFGVRACLPLVSPCALGLTANTTLNSTSVTISSASTFVNGDGVVIYGAGAPHSMPTPSAPTVTPSLPRVMTGTRDVVNGPTGATTYNYQIFAEDKNGGLTAVSAVGSTTTGASSLGSQSVNLTSCSRANDIVTCTTSSAHGLATGTTPQMVLIQGTVDSTFASWYSTTNVADSTHFSYQGGMDTRNGATTSTTGGTLTWWNCNHITWSAVTGAYRYWIAGRTGGSLTTLGVSWPTNSLSPTLNGTLSWDDFGSAMLVNFRFPAWIPATPPSVATSDHLVTTIASGAGTTSLTLANQAGTTVSGATIRLDATPGIKAAEAAAQGGPTVGTFPIYFPNSSLANATYVVNSSLDLTSFTTPTLLVPGGLWLNNTLLLPNFSKMDGGTKFPTVDSAPSFGWEGLPVITDSTAYPGIHIVAAGGTVIEGAQITADTSGSTGGNVSNLVVQDQGGGSAGATYRRVNFVTGTSSDYLGIALTCRGNPSGSCMFQFDQVLSLSGPGNTLGLTATPDIYCDDCAEPVIRSLFLSHRGILIGADTSNGTTLRLDWGYIQGGVTPFLSFAASLAGGFVASAQMGSITLDTFSNPLFTTFTGASVLLVNVVDNSNSIPSGGISPYSGSRPGTLFGRASFSNGTGGGGVALGTNKNSCGMANSGNNSIDGIFSPLSGIGVFHCNAYVGTGPSEGMFIDSLPSASISAVVAAGGSVPVATHTYSVVPVWQNNGSSCCGPQTSATTTPGNQTVNLTWTAVSGNCKGYEVIRDGAQLTVPPTVTGCSTTSFSDAIAAATGASAPAQPAGGPTMLMPGVQGIATPAMILGGSQSVASVQGTDTSLLSSGTISNGTGVSLCTDASHGATTSGCPSAGTFYQTVDANGTAQTQRPTLNLISGANATVSCVDNAGATRTDCTFAANSVTAWSSITAATNANAGTFAATGNTWDFSGATSFKVPVAGGAAPTADGTIADNSTTHGLNFGSNGNTLNVAVASTGAGGTGTTCAANSAVTALSNTAAPTCTQLTGGGLPYTNWGVNGACAQTGSGAGATQTCTISFNTTEANTSYKIVCGGTGTITGYPFMQGVITKNTTNAVVQYTNGTSNEAVVSGWANIECIVTR